MARYAKQKTPQAVRNPFEPMLKTVEQMAVVSGIGENRLRQLMDNGELEFTHYHLECLRASMLLAFREE